MNRMCNECCKNLLVLNEEELQSCNGGTVAMTEESTMIVIFPHPKPDKDHRL